MSTPTPGIEELLAGDLSVATFAQEYWEKKALLLQGQPNRLTHLFSLERLRAFLKRSPFPAKSHLLAYFDRHWNIAPVGQGGTVPTFAIPPQDAVSAYEAGATVGVFKLEEGIPELRATCRGLRVGLGLLSEPTAAALWSPDQRGFGPHFDCIGTTILQLEGAKKWKYSEIPGVPWPVSNASLRGGVAHYFEIDDRTDAWEREIDPASLQRWTEVTLTPGDVLFLPPGFWHTASADGTSLAITIQTVSTRAPAFLCDLLRAATYGSAWDTVPPLLARGGLHGGLNDAARGYLDARLAELEQQIRLFRQDPRELLRHWVAVEGASDPPPAPPAPPTALGADSTTYAIGPSCRALSGPAELECLIAVRGTVHRFEAAQAPVLRQILRRRRFRLGDLAGAGLERAALVELLERLLASEVVHVVG